MDIDRFIVRHFLPSDFSAESPITVNAWESIFSGFRSQLGEEIYSFFYDGWEKRKFDEFGNSMLESSQDGNAFSIIDSQNGTVVAMGSFCIRDGSGIIESNAVHPDYRGHGIGTVLYRTLLEKMNALSLRDALVTTGLDDAHTGARKTYERVGFQPFSKQSVYFRNNEITAFPALTENKVYTFQRISDPILFSLENLFGGMDKTVIHNIIENPHSITYVLLCGEKPMCVGSWHIGSLQKKQYGQIDLLLWDDAFSAMHMQKHLLQDMLSRNIRFSKTSLTLKDANTEERKMYENAGFLHSISSVTYKMNLR
ncbi:MAG: GNAT family N-acetyltransferase [Clostridia bacterium]|nr:GNAT family N-acetyltransferase [Clostridia bacterium]